MCFVAGVCGPGAPDSLCSVLSSQRKQRSSKIKAWQTRWVSWYATTAVNASFIAKWHFSLNSWRIWFFYSGEAIKVFKNISNLVDVSSLGELFWKRFHVERFPFLSSPQPNSLLTALLSLMLTLTHNKPPPPSYWSFNYSHTVPL